MSHILSFTTLILFLTYLTNAQLSLYATRDDDLIAGKRVLSPTWIRRSIAADDDAIYNPYQGMNGIRVSYVTRNPQKPLKQRKGKKSKKPKKPKFLYADDDEFTIKDPNFPWWLFVSTPEQNGPQYRNKPAQNTFNKRRVQTQAADDDVFAGIVYNGGIPQQWNKPAEYKFNNPSTRSKIPSWMYNNLVISDDDVVAGQRIGLFSFYDDDEIAGQRIDVADDSDQFRPYYVIEEQKRRGDDDHIAGVRANYNRSNRRRSGTTSTDDDERIRINDPNPTFPRPKKPIWVDDDDDDDLIAGLRVDQFRRSDHDEIIRINQRPGKPIRPTYPVWTMGPSRPRSGPVYADDDEYTRINYGGASYGGSAGPIWVDDDMISGKRVFRG